MRTTAIEPTSPGPDTPDVKSTRAVSESLLRKAGGLSGISDRAELINAGLSALIERESARRLAELGGSMPRVAQPRRRRNANA